MLEVALTLKSKHDAFLSEEGHPLLFLPPAWVASRHPASAHEHRYSFWWGVIKRWLLGCLYPAEERLLAAVPAEPYPAFPSPCALPLHQLLLNFLMDGMACTLPPGAAQASAHPHCFLPSLFRFTTFFWAHRFRAVGCLWFGLIFLFSAAQQNVDV